MTAKAAPRKAAPRKASAPRNTTATTLGKVDERIATLEAQVTEITGHVELMAKLLAAIVIAQHMQAPPQPQPQDVLQQLLGSIGTTPQ